MAEVILKNIKKIYPHQEPKKKKKGEPEKKTNLQITEEGVLAVDNFNLHIQDKEFIVLVGPSGCGKSTTLRMVAGLEEISGGELYIGGQLMNDVAPKDRDISMVFQNYALYPHMTVRENIAFPLKLRKMDKAEIDQRVEQAAQELINLLGGMTCHVNLIPINEIRERDFRKSRSVERFQKRWAKQLAAGDPCMNPNFDLMKEDFSFDIKPLE